MRSKPRKKVGHLIRLGKTSLVAVIPPKVVRSLGWKEGQRVLVKRMPRGVLIRDALTKRRK